MGPLPNPFRRPQAKPEPEVVRARADLERIASDKPTLAGPASTLGRLLPVVFGPDATGTVRFDPAILGDEDCRRRLTASAVPAFAQLPLAWDRVAIGRQFTGLLDALATPEAKPLKAAWKRSPDPIREWRIGAFPADFSAVETAAQAAGLDGDLVAATLRLALLGGLAGLSRAIEAAGIASRPTGGHCPHCGERASMAETRGIDAARFLRCSRCTADWSTARMECPFCPATEAGSVRTWALEGQENRRRLIHCRACDGRLLVVSTLGRLSGPALLVAELEALPLQIKAATDPGAMSPGGRE